MTIVMASVMLLATAASIAAAGLPSPSRDTAVTSDDQGVEAARAVVAELLRDHGLTEYEVQERLAALTDEDVLQLSQHAKQIQEGGSVPNYIWILLAVLIGVTILATI